MKKLLLFIGVLVLIIGLFAFKYNGAIEHKTNGTSLNKLKHPIVFKKGNFTTFVVGYYTASGTDYYVIGDNFGGSSGNVVGLNIGSATGTPSPFPLTGTWNCCTYGTCACGLGATVNYTAPPANYHGVLGE
jgi:hypothetical protein